MGFPVMIKGISSEEEKIIQNILAAYKKDYEFYYYGSRVKGNFEKTSDLDILIKSKIPYEKLEIIKFLFDQSNLPYVVNFTDYDTIDEKFYKLIEKDLVRI